MNKDYDYEKLLETYQNNIYKQKYDIYEYDKYHKDDYHKRLMEELEEVVKRKTEYEYQKRRPTDEEILEGMDIKVIEAFLRRKKLEALRKEK